MAVGNELNCCGNELEGVDMERVARADDAGREQKNHDTSGKFTFYLLLSSAFHRKQPLNPTHQHCAERAKLTASAKDRDEIILTSCNFI